jgi:hypothetical protein
VLPQDPPKTCEKENPSISRVHANRNASVANKGKEFGTSLPLALEIYLFW